MPHSRMSCGASGIMIMKSTMCVNWIAASVASSASSRPRESGIGAVTGQASGGPRVAAMTVAEHGPQHRTLRYDGRMLVNCVAYQNGRKLADIPVEDISEYVSRPDCFVWVALHDPTEASST
jgi:hypothetical protein